jgi:hypothetical protein
MNFFVRYVLGYLAGVALLAALAGYAVWGMESSGAAWTALAALLVWLICYVPAMLWLDYRRFMRLAAQARDVLAKGAGSAELRPLLLTIATEHIGLPGFIARRIIDRLPPEKLAAKLEARRAKRAPDQAPPV